MTRSLILFDDEVARGWEPFLLTRPCSELLFGALLLRERAESFWGCHCSGSVTRASLDGFDEEGAPPVVGPQNLPVHESRVIQLSRAALQGSAPTTADEPSTLFLRDSVVGWILPPGEPGPGLRAYLSPEPLKGSRRVEVEGELLEAPWDLIARNARQLGWDIPRFFPGYAAEDLPGCHILGDGLISLGRDVAVEPGSVFDVREGPIRLSDRVTVRSHTRLAGPAFIGAGSTLLGGSLSQVSVGPVCKVMGEVEASTLLGYTNKAHEGFLGHSYAGRWVNLGAFTTTSDLKNNYGNVRVGSSRGPLPTGLMKVGCFFGDHVKTGIGTLLNTGTTVGAGSNLFGGKIPPTWVPPFSWGNGDHLTTYLLEKFLEVASRAMARRGMTLTEGGASLLRRAWEESRGEGS